MVIKLTFWTDILGEIISRGEAEVALRTDLTRVLPLLVLVCTRKASIWCHRANTTEMGNWTYPTISSKTSVWCRNVHPNSAVVT